MGSRRLGEAVGYRDDGRLLQSEHEAEVVREVLEECLLGRTWITEYGRQTEVAKQSKCRLADTQNPPRASTRIHADRRPFQGSGCRSAHTAADEWRARILLKPAWVSGAARDPSRRQHHLYPGRGDPDRWPELAPGRTTKSAHRGPAGQRKVPQAAPDRRLLALPHSPGRPGERDRRLPMVPGRP